MEKFTYAVISEHNNNKLVTLTTEDFYYSYASDIIMKNVIYFKNKKYIFLKGEKYNKNFDVSHLQNNKLTDELIAKYFITKSDCYEEYKYKYLKRIYYRIIKKADYNNKQRYFNSYLPYLRLKQTTSVEFILLRDNYNVEIIHKKTCNLIKQ